MFAGYGHAVGVDDMRIYAALRVPEVWRYDEAGLAFFALNADGKYDPAQVSACFSIPIAPADLMPFIKVSARRPASLIN